MPFIVTAVHSPLVPLMVRGVPLLYSPRMEADMDAAEAAGSLVIFEDFDPRG